MISKKILVIFLFITIIFSVIFLACDNTMIEKQNSNFSVKIPIAQLYNNSNSFTNLTYNISAWLETENTILQTKTQKIMAEETSAILEFDNIFVGQKVRVRIEITQDELETPKYTGLSDWFIVKMGKNNVKVPLSSTEQPIYYIVTF